jgi:3-oxoadipate enol-lactonase
VTSEVSVPGATLLVIDEGPSDGPPIVLLHAGIADSRAWDALVPHLVAAGHRVIRYDRRGFGRTITEDVEFSNRADLVAILDALGIERTVLVGNSQGGQIAIDTAIEYPDRVAAVVGVGAGLGGFEGETSAEELALFEGMEALEERLDAGETAVLDELLDLDVAVWVDGPGQPSDRVPAPLRDLVRAMDRDHYDPGRVQGRPIPLRPPAAERLTELRIPVLAVAGALDVGDVAETARHLAASLPAATAVVWPDVAHLFGMEAPERLAGLILDFLAPLPRWS